MITASTSPYSSLLRPPKGMPKMNKDGPGKQFIKDSQAFAHGYNTTLNLEMNGADRRARRETAGVSSLAPGHFAALYGAAPELAMARDAMLSRLSGTGPSELSAELESQALTDLRQGGDLSPQEQRQAYQSARGAFASRGMLYGNQAAVGDVLARQQFADARRGTRRAFAMQVDEMARNREQQDRAFTSTAFGQLFDTLDPYKRIYGGYSRQGGANGTLDQALSMHNTNRDYTAQTNNMVLSDQRERRMAMMNADIRAQEMKAQQKAGIISGAMGAFGSIGGALLG